MLFKYHFFSITDKYQGYEHFLSDDGIRVHFRFATLNKKRYTRLMNINHPKSLNLYTAVVFSFYLFESIINLISNLNL